MPRVFWIIIQVGRSVRPVQVLKLAMDNLPYHMVLLGLRE